MKDFNDILKEKLYDYQKTPPIEVFDAVRKKYPKKKTFSTAKVVIISSLLVSIITSILLIYILPQKKENNNIVAEKNIITNTITPKIENNENQIKEILLENNNNDINIEEIQKNNTEIKVKKINYFNFNDTTICGLSLETNIFDNTQNIIIPQELKLYTLENKYNFVAEKTGKYFIKYKEIKGNEILIDSVSIDYKNVNLAKFNYSAEKLCYNQNLIITADNPNNYKIEIDIPEAKIVEKSKNKYEISNLHSGENPILITYMAENCRIEEKNKIEVSDKINYKIEQKADYCSGNNGEIKIKLSKCQADFYLLDNEQVNKTGVFKNIHSGIHTILIKYNESCYINDTIFVYDSLKLKPYFVSDKGLIDKNSYLFNNMTEIDYNGFEKNKEIEFSWFIDNELISDNDNLSYQFEKTGKHNVKLVAKINDACIREYSEDIIISGNNLNIPNVFTPNGDGIGDIFEIKYKNNVLKYNIKIFGTNGDILFESDDINNSWDGKISGNNDAIVGSYYYIISIIEADGTPASYEGNIQLLR